MVRFKGNVGVQVADDFVLEAFDFLIPGVERPRLRGKAAIPPLGPLHQFNPRITFQIAAHDLGSLSVDPSSTIAHFAGRTV